MIKLIIYNILSLTNRGMIPYNSAKYRYAQPIKNIRFKSFKPNAFNWLNHLNLMFLIGCEKTCFLKSHVTQSIDTYRYPDVFRVTVELHVEVDFMKSTRKHNPITVSYGNSMHPLFKYARDALFTVMIL